MQSWVRFIGVVSVLVALGFSTAPASAQAQVPAQDSVVALVNGKPITEADMRLAEVDLSNDLATVAAENRRRVLLEYLIENQLLADAAEQAKIATDVAVEQQQRFARRRILRDYYYDTRISATVTEAEAKALYEKELRSATPQEQVKVRHILVTTEDEAREARKRIVSGTPFSNVAQEISKDTLSAPAGGDIDYIKRGELDAQFEVAAFSLQVGVISEPVQSQFGWHLITVDDRRKNDVPQFDAIKGSILALLIQRKALSTVSELRTKAQLDVKDRTLAAAIEASSKRAAPVEPQATSQPASVAVVSSSATPPPATQTVASAAAAGALPATSAAQTSKPATAAAQVQAGIWRHNGSLMRLETTESGQRILYETPREGLGSVKITPGTQLFIGTRSLNEFKGQATTYSGRCPPRDYPVAGQMSEDQKRLVLRGQAPASGNNCEVSGSRDETLQFDFVRSGG